MMRTKKVLPLVLFTAALANVWNSHALAKPELTHTRIFETNGKVFYRIPALVITNEGTLLAVCNGRVGTPRDHCPYVQLIVRRSTDNGKTWSPMQMIQDREGWVATGGAGIVDPTTGEIMFHFTWAPGTADAKNARIESDPKNHTGHMIARSTDDGKTWKCEPKKLEPNSYGSKGSTHGSDTGVVLRYGEKKGRLLMAARTGIKIKDKDGKEKHVGCNCAIYSDDHGKTWKTSGVVQPHTGEGCLAELPDGLIYFNSRTGGDGWRLTAMSKDCGETYGDFAKSDALRDCNFGTAASVLSVSKEVHGRHFVLFTNAAHNQSGFNVVWNRKKFTASVSFDGTKTWPLKKVINPGPSGYSASVMSKGGEFFVLYEKGDKHYRDKGVSIVKFNLEWLLDGKDLRDF